MAAQSTSTGSSGVAFWLMKMPPMVCEEWASRGEPSRQLGFVDIDTSTGRVCYLPYPWRLCHVAAQLYLPSLPTICLSYPTYPTLASATS
jgi:hypothetical protein